MTCHDARELFSALIDEALNAGEHRAVEAHLATCADCRRELERLRSTVSLLRAVEPARAPVGFVDRTLAAAQPTPWYRRLVGAVFLPWPVKIPAEVAAIVLVAVGVVYLYRVTPDLRQWDQMVSQQAPAPREPRSQLSTPPPARESSDAARLEALRPATPGVTPSTPPPSASAPSVAFGPASSEAPPAARERRPAREYMEKEGLKDDSSRDEGKLEATPETSARGQAQAPDAVRSRAAQVPPTTPPAPESRADAQTLAKRQPAPLSNIASFVPPDVSGRLAVTDREVALRGLDDVVARLGAVVDRRLVGSEGPIIELSVTREAYPELVRELARLGRWQPTREPADLPAQIRVLLRITS